MKADAKFWAKVDKTGECWVWTGSKVRGYGHLSRSRGGVVFSLRAHRVSWETVHGPIPEGLSVCHRCDNPSCVRPDHLFIGTQAENLSDMRRKGRGSKPPRRLGSAHCRARLTEAQVLEAIAAKAAGKKLAPLARRFGVRNNTLHMAVSGGNWRHLRA